MTGVHCVTAAPRRSSSNAQKPSAVARPRARFRTDHREGIERNDVAMIVNPRRYLAVRKVIGGTTYSGSGSVEFDSTPVRPTDLSARPTEGEHPEPQD